MSFNSEELEPIKVLVVDDHTLFAEGTVSLLSFDPRILVVGIAKNGIECMILISETVPDVVLLDIQLPDISGIDLMHKIKKVQPEVKIIILTGHNSKSYISKSISEGTNGFLLKDCSVKEMIETIFKIHNEGGVCFSQRVYASLQPVINTDFHLTIREMKIIELVSRGLHNKEISSTLGINVRTVESHISSILFKLGVRKRFEAVLQWKNINNISNLKK